jgi:DNA-binding CsgD family transcriptional regulator
MAAVAGCWALWHAGRFEESARLASAAHAAAIRYGVDRRHGPWFTANQAHAMFELGHLEEAEKLARSLDEHRYVGMWTVIAKMEAVRGSFEAARAAMRTDDLWNSPLWRLETAVFIDRAAGDFAGVRAHMQAAEAELRASEVVSPVWLTLGSAIGAAADHASAARRRRQHAEAEAAVSLGGRWLEQLREIVDDGRANGGAGRFREATLAMAESEMQRVTTGSDPMTWADVVERWCALAHPHGTASAELRHAESLLMGNQNQAAAAVLPRRAHATATTLGAVPLRGAIETMARHARIDLAPAPGTDPGRPPGGEPTPDGRSPLTAREREVLGLVAHGHTNREIGEQLFISEKTVSVHVSNAMSKLGALSRYEAAASAQRTGQLG